MTASLSHPWVDVPVWTLFRSVARESNGSGDVLSLHRGLGVIKKGSVEGNHNRTPEDLTRYQAVKAEDVVVNRMKAWQGSAGVAPQQGIISAHYLVFEPLAEAYDSRFLEWLLGSPLMIERYQGASVGIRTSQWELSRGAFAELRLPLPPLETQRRIAEMLDVETARIDTLIAKNQRVLELLDFRMKRLIETVVYDAGADATDTPLHYLCDPQRPIRYGIVLPGPDVDEGVPLIKGGDVHGHTLREGTQCRVAHDIEERHPQSRVRSGDIVYAIRGSFGDVDLVPGGLDGANITQDVARIAPATRVEPTWLLYALRAPGTLAQAVKTSRGATISGVNIENLRKFRVPVPTYEVQKAVAARLADHEQRMNRLAAEVSRQQGLLRTRRQALVTAAVTGQIDV
jgi:type I restriction enzyme, S subunit